LSPCFNFVILSVSEGSHSFIHPLFVILPPALSSCLSAFGGNLFQHPFFSHPEPRLPIVILSAAAKDLIDIALWQVNINRTPKILRSTATGRLRSE
jgi:hypothetical protein